MPEFHLFKKKQIIQLIRVLRLSILLNGQRNDDPLPDISLIVDDKDCWKLACPQADWLEENKLLAADLITEQEFWKRAAWSLEF